MHSVFEVKKEIPAKPWVDRTTLKASESQSGKEFAMWALSRLARSYEAKVLPLISVSLVLAALTTAGAAAAEKKPDAGPIISCSALHGQTIESVQVTSAAEVAATASVPAYCKVDGTRIGTQLDIEVRLPDNWQRRLVQEGGGGFDGIIWPVGKKDVALNLHAVQVLTNGGHRIRSPRDFLHDPAKIQLYAYTAIGEGLKFAKAVIAKYYGSEPNYSYFEGCSNGGRDALNAADKYGEKFDAVIAGAPTRNLPGLIEEWTRAARLPLPSAAKLAAVRAAAVAKCDALDGVKDGIISNWMACTFDPTVDVPKSVGLTATEAAAVKTLMTRLKLSDGETIYSGYLFGSMARMGRAYAGLGIGHMRYIVLSDPDWDPKTFTVDRSYRTISKVIDSTYGFDASVSGLAHFLESGKKIVLWQGSDDALLALKDTIRTWQPVAQAAGDAALKNSRIYVASGVNHCRGGPGADTFDLLTPTVSWVEKGIDPGTPVASKLNSAGTVEFTRPLCRYPAYPKYKGSGDVNSSNSYSCSFPDAGAHSVRR